MSDSKYNFTVPQMSPGPEADDLDKVAANKAEQEAARTAETTRLFTEAKKAADALNEEYLEKGYGTVPPSEPNAPKEIKVKLPVSTLEKH